MYQNLASACSHNKIRSQNDITENAHGSYIDLDKLDYNASLHHFFQNHQLTEIQF